MTRTLALDTFDRGDKARLSIAALSCLLDDAAPADAPARVDPYKEGYEAGRTDAVKEWSAAVRSLRSAVADIRRTERDLDRRYREETALRLAEVIHAAAPRIALASVITETRWLLDRAARPAPIEAIELRASAALLAEIRQGLASEGADIACAFVEDPSIAEGDLAASWPGGGLFCGAASAIAAIGAFLDEEMGRNQTEERSA